MSNPKLSDIITAIPVLSETGANWSIFKMRFRLALLPHGLYHFYVPDKRHQKPVNPIKRTIGPTDTLTQDETKCSLHPLACDPRFDASQNLLRQPACTRYVGDA